LNLPYEEAILLHDPMELSDMRRFVIGYFVAIVTLLSGPGCDSRKVDPGDSPAIADANGFLAVRVLVPEDIGPGLAMAVDDLVEVMSAITGARVPEDAVIHDPLDAAGHPVVSIQVVPDADELGDQGYWLDCGKLGGGSPALTVTGANETAAMYGVYHVIGDMGVRYLHPQETFIPSKPDAILPWDHADVIQAPRFDVRGFHEHTQHPIPASDFLLRSGNEEFRRYASDHLKWLARNRQNTLTFHMLKTLDLDTWLPYISDIVKEAHGYGISVGLVTGFDDQQQNAYRLVREDNTDPDTGKVLPDDVQIRDGLDRFLEAGFDIFVFQIGSSEFTKPDEARVIEWLNTAVAHVRGINETEEEDDTGEGDAVSPLADIRTYAWIHVTCGLKTDDGHYFFHLPLEADADLGAFVHTTMFYDLEHSAPVYGCQETTCNFTHQQQFMAHARDQGREQTYFPESAWWLGFDNNVPLALPITGYSREYDIREVLPRFVLEDDEDSESEGYSITGHVTFTTGREWSYWQYDHYLTQATWNEGTTWDDYLDYIAPLYGDAGDVVVQALKAWTDLQEKHFYMDNPEIYFYLAGELLQDEVGAKTDFLARRPKLSFCELLGYGDDDFLDWESGDFDMLVSMKVEYQVLLDTLPQALEGGTQQQKDLYSEVRDVLYVYVRRIEHAIALYDGVAAARDWHMEKSDRQSSLARAETRLEEARSITGEVKEIFEAAEARYRYPVDLLSRAKPESPTIYKFGYLDQTTSALFWHRRDEQFADLMGMVFGQTVEEWQVQPQTLFRTDQESTSVEVPDTDLAKTAISDFIPTLLFGVVPPKEPGGTMTLVIAQDRDGSDLPDPGTEKALDLDIGDDDWWASDGADYTITVRDDACNVLGALTIRSPRFLAVPGFSDGASLKMEGDVDTQPFVTMIETVTGSDNETSVNFVKMAFGIELSKPLPQTAPIRLGFILEKP